MDTVDFHETLQNLIDQSGLTYLELSQAIGKSESYISKLMKAKSMPTIEVLAALAKELHKTPNDLLGFPAQVRLSFDEHVEDPAASTVKKHLSRAADHLSQAYQPTIESVVHWWKENEGYLKDFETIEPWSVVMVRPEENDVNLTPYKVGDKSVAAKLFGTRDLKTIVESVHEIVSDDQTSTLRKYATIVDDNLDLSVRKLFLKTKDNKTIHILNYLRLLLALQPIDGRPLVLNYSIILGGDQSD